MVKELSSTKNRFVINSRQIADAAFICYFSRPIITLLFKGVLGFVGLKNEAELCVLVVVYGLLLVACLLNPKQYLKLDCVLLLVFVCLFFAVTLCIHPEYEYWYKRTYYGVWDHVLKPSNGLYAYLFIRLMDRPERCMKNLKISGWIMYLYFAYIIVSASRRGYWVGVSGQNSNAEFTYSVSFGYSVLLFAMVFLYCAIRDKRAADIIASGIGIAMIVFYGSRGPMLCIAAFLLIILIRSAREKAYSARKLLGSAVVIVSIVLIYAFYNEIVSFLIATFTKYGLSSRFLEKLMNGTISNDSGRSLIWKAALDMIKENPFGYGAMGSQHIISHIIVAGYPHSVILEILIDFGVFFGGGLLLFFGWQTVKLLFRKDYPWGAVFIPIFATACSMFMSLTFWSTKSFWICIAIGVNQYYYNRKCALQKERAVIEKRLA